MAPAGRVWTVAPDTSKGAPARASAASVRAAAAVEDEDGTCAVDRELPPVADDDGGVLVDADPEQVRRRCHDGQQPAVPGALVEVLVDDDPREQSEASGELAAALAWGDALVAHGDHEVGHDRGARRRAAHDAPSVMGAVQGLTERRPGDELGEPELAAARDEHSGRLVDRRHRLRVVGVVARRGVDDEHVRSPESA